jgi:tripeptide aminopeptidase
MPTSKPTGKPRTSKTASKPASQASSKKSVSSTATAPATPNDAREPDLVRALDVVMELMAIRGGSGDEGAAAEYVRQKLLAAGLPESAMVFDKPPESHLQGKIGSLIVKFPGTIKGPRRMLSAHLDTVPICIGSQPKRDGAFVRSADPNTGLGADDRAGVSVVLLAALEILERQLPHPPLTFCFFVQEEIGLYGARFVNHKLLGKPELAFNFDGGSPAKLTIGATGAYRMTIDVHGIASHAGGAPEQGVSAIAIAGIAMAELHRQGWHGDVRKGKQRGTSNVGVINGGDATNVVTNRVSLRAEARSHDPKFRERIAKEIENQFKLAAKEVKNVAGKAGSVSVERRMDYESYRLDPKSPSVVAAHEAVVSAGATPELAISNGGLDSNWLFAHGISAVTLGCGQMNQHMVTEALNIADFELACRVGLRLAMGTT